MMYILNSDCWPLLLHVDTPSAGQSTEGIIGMDNFVYHYYTSWQMYIKEIVDVMKYIFSFLVL